MNKQEYDNQQIIAYLLGTLPEADTEVFDEMSFTDDEFTAELKAAEKDLIDAYIQGELKGSMLEKFKSHYLASPLRCEKVEFARAFQVFADKNSAIQSANVQDEIVDSESGLKLPTAGFFSKIFAPSHPLMQWSFAVVALTVLIIGGWIFFESSQNQLGDARVSQPELERQEKEFQDDTTDRQTPDSKKGQEIARLEQERKQNVGQNRNRLEERPLNTQKKPPPRNTSVASFVLAPQLRGVNQIKTLSIPAETGSVAMRLELESNNYDAYRVILRSPSGNGIIWQSGKIKAKYGNENKSLSITIPAALLKSQIYTLEVSGISSGGTAEIISDYSFKIVRE